MTASNTGETVRVIVRCRPMNQREIDLKCKNVITMNAQLNQVMLENIEQTNEPPKQFTFDAVYPTDSITDNIYSDTVFPLVESVLEGYNGTVFAYGQTGCGKSFTMQGVNTPGSPQRGIIPRSFEHIFEASSVTAGTKYLIRASYLEIYNETIRDLLGKDIKATLELKEYVDKGIHVQNLSWHQCTSVADCERLMDKGNKHRVTGATLMNKDSSRSHSIFTILTEMCTRSEQDGKEHIRAGKLNLVDLAGSERQSKTQAEGERLREATRINLSLSALGNVISALVDGRSKHIPYRDSKLTRLLQDSLGGNTKTIMIAAISPAHDNYDETLSTLRYANRAKNIKNKPHINEDPRDAQMKLLQEEINRLKQELLNVGTLSRGDQFGSSDDTRVKPDFDDEIEREQERLRAEFEREASELRRQCAEERLTKEELQRKYDNLKGQYDTNIDALNSNLGSQRGQYSKENAATRHRAKKKDKSIKEKRDDQPSTTDQYEDGDENASIPIDDLNPEEKLKRLQELEHKLIGGEEVNNEERKKKRRKKLNEMHERQERRKRFEKLVNGTDDNMMMNVFDNVQEELRFTSKKLEDVHTENKRLIKDNEDLQYEFEQERQGYLNTIRAQEKQLLLYRAIVDKMSSTMQRNCNYSNIDKIIEQVRYDEEKNEYSVPDPIQEEVQFPQVANLHNARAIQSDFITPSKAAAPSRTDYQYDYVIPSQSVSTYNNQIANMTTEELQRRYGRNIDVPNISFGKALNKRQEQLLNQNSKIHPLQMNNTDQDYMNRRLNPFEAPSRLTRKYGFSTDKQ